MNLKSLAQKLDSAAIKTHPVNQLSNTESFDLDTAYEIQRLMIDERLQRSESLIGIKMGFTSEAKMRQMGVHDMIWGRLTDAMMISNGAEVGMNAYIHPRAEPEICFRVVRDINREIPLEDLDDYVDGMAPAIEIIDSRYENFRFSLEDVVADNCSSAGLVVGEWHEPHRAIDHLRMTLSFDEQVVAAGSSADILGDPWKALQAATRLASAYAHTIRAGHIVMAGAATAAQFIHAGLHIQAEVEEMGSVHFSVRA